MNSRNLSIPSIQNWLERLNNVLENYDYDLKTAATIQDIPKPGLCSWSDNMKLANYNTNSIIAEDISASEVNRIPEITVIPSGSKVTIMDVNQANDTVYVRGCSEKENEIFLENIFRVHIAHLNAKPFENFARINNMCVTQFKKDDIWYRARVIKIIETFTYLVRFVDFGAVEKVH
uniref:Tudor domain-containing protein n=1 Tax=Megaselia scalaris TaxID=36166 RepID=T1GJQ6_MEGSC